MVSGSALSIAAEKGCNVDNPKNLANSVMME